MSKKPSAFLGIEGGATHSTFVLLDQDGKILKRAEAGPCNLRLISNREMVRLFKSFRMGTSPAAIGVFLAGCRTAPDKERIRLALNKVWPGIPRVIGNDAASAFAASLGHRDGILLICGTGSIILSRRGKVSLQIGGWGHVGGDEGSGYWMSRKLLRWIFRSCDLHKPNPPGPLASSVLAFLGLNTMEDLVQWSLEASKDELASLTKVLFRHQKRKEALGIIHDAAEHLAADVHLAAQKTRLHSIRNLEVAVNGGLPKHQPLFFEKLRAAIQRKLPGARVQRVSREGALGAAWLAMESSRHHPLPSPSSPTVSSSAVSAPPLVKTRGLALALTEQRNPRTLDLDRRSIPHLVETMLAEESHTIPAIRTQKKQISKTIGWIVQSLKQGGRLFYIGAGTSGRVGVLDASEIPPTYGCDPEMVQGIMAGGWRALYQSMESVEDDAHVGRQIVTDHGISHRDVLVGIAASGSTPFVLGALEQADRKGARTVLLTFNPQASFTIKSQRFQKIAIPTGPEAVTGSTRLKAGTATKLVLNMFTTIAMVRMGKVKSNLMIDVEPGCEKLHDRAARIYSALKKVPYETAWTRLEASNWNLKSLISRS